MPEQPDVVEPEHRPEGHVSLDTVDDNLFASLAPMRSEGLALEQVVKMLRLRHCMSFLRPEQVDLLYRKYIESQSYDELGEQLETTRQAAFQRVRTARRDLVRAVRDHWNDDLDLDQLPVTTSDDPYADADEGLVPRA